MRGPGLTRAFRREYFAWRHARRRCTEPGHPKFDDYGGRGIQMCERWRHDFGAFLADIGPCPDGLTLDRIDNDWHYEPGNCRWADRCTQARNNRRAIAARRRVADAIGRLLLRHNIAWPEQNGG